MARKKYNKIYYLSDFWKHYKKCMFEFNGEKCEHCGSVQNLNIHHKNYDTFGGDELPFDLLILCKTCHANLHDTVKKVMNGEIWLG